MTTAKKLIFIVFIYLLASISLSFCFQEYLDQGWSRSQVRWTYLAWVFIGPLSAIDTGWQALAPIRQHLSAFLAGGLVVVPLLAAPLFLRGRIPAWLCAIGLIMWAALGASLVVVPGLDAEIDRLIAAAADLP